MVRFVRTMEQAEKHAKNIDQAIKEGYDVQFAADDLKEFQEMVVLSEQEIRVNMKKEEIEVQEKRLEQLKQLMGLMEDVHQKVNDDQAKQDSISDACQAVIKNTHQARKDLGQV